LPEQIGDAGCDRLAAVFINIQAAVVIEVTVNESVAGGQRVRSGAVAGSGVTLKNPGGGKDQHQGCR